jgi:hypothetical protein
VVAPLGYEEGVVLRRTPEQHPKPPRSWIERDHVPGSQIAKPVIQPNQDVETSEIAGRARVEYNRGAEAMLTCKTQISIVSDYRRVRVADRSRTGSLQPQQMSPVDRRAPYRLGCPG